MENQYKHFKDLGVEVVAVNVGESKIAVHNFMKTYGVNFPVALDTDLSKCWTRTAYHLFRRHF